MRPPQGLGARLALSMAGVMLLSGLLMIALAFGVLYGAERAQVARLPPEVRAELNRLDALDSRGETSAADRRRLLLLLAEYPIGAGPGTIALAVVAPITVVSALGAGLAALVARRLAAPIGLVEAQARCLADGDLTARSGPGARTPYAREVASLMDSVDRLSERLEWGERTLRRDAAMIAHELRTPLMVLHGRLEALADGVFAPSEDEFRRLVGQATLLGRVVEDLATLSLAQAGRLVLRRELTDLMAAAQAAAHALGERARAAGVVLRLDLRPAPVVGDPARLAQAAAALLDNALRHGAAGGEVGLETLETEGDAVLRVLDRGPGVPASLRVRVFDPFARGTPSVVERQDGSGLGLAVVQVVTDAHGGSVRAEARHGGGAAFTMVLPSAS